MTDGSLYLFTILPVARKTNKPLSDLHSDPLNVPLIWMVRDVGNQTRESTFLHFGQHSYLERAYWSHLIRHNFGAHTWFCHSGLCKTNRKVTPDHWEQLSPVACIWLDGGINKSLAAFKWELCGQMKGYLSGADSLVGSRRRDDHHIFHRVKSLLTWNRWGTSEGSLHLRGCPLPAHTPTAAVVHGGPAVTLQTLELAVESAKRDGGVICAVFPAPLHLMESRLEVTQTYLTLMVGTLRANC